MLAGSVPSELDTGTSASWGPHQSVRAAKGLTTWLLASSGPSVVYGQSPRGESEEGDLRLLHPPTQAPQALDKHDG